MRWVKRLRTLLVWLTTNRKLWARVPSVFSINLSSQSMTDGQSFVSFVKSCVTHSGLPPQAFVLRCYRALRGVRQHQRR